MDRNELLKHLSEYGSAVNSGGAKTSHFTDIKNKIRAAYDAGNIDKDLMKQLSDKVSGAFKNMGRSLELENLPGKVIQKGGTVGAVEGMKSRFPSLVDTMSGVKKAGAAIKEDLPKGSALSLVKNSSGFAKALPMLGLGATALAGLGIANKLQAGEIEGAGIDAADIATDYAPVVGQVKMAIKPTELGDAELPKDEASSQEDYNASQVPPEGYQSNRFRFKNTMSKLQK